MTAVVVLGPGGLAVARRIQAVVPDAVVHGLHDRVEGADLTFDNTAVHLRRLFQSGEAIIGVCAAGILIRALGPILLDKQHEPAVLAVSLDGGVVVPLLSGHHGANALARRLAAGLGGVAAVTTAGDTAFGVALDEPPPGWRIANPEAAKPVVAALLAGEPVRLTVEAGDASWLAGLPFAAEGSLGVLVTDRAAAGDGRTLVLHPPVLALGVGCERNADPAELSALVRDTLAAHGLSPLAVACVASLELKSDEPAVLDLARDFGVPARFFSAGRLEAETPRLANPSEAVFKATGCHGVAEGAALAAAGASASLIVPKHKTARATCAVARVAASGGTLAVVGIGPGSLAWRTPEANRAVAEAEVVVGYRLYLDLLGPAIQGKERHDSPLGEEAARARLALDLAGQGKRVALVCSGDPGIYALATLVYELLEREAAPAWAAVEVTVVPGISALQAAAARAGAPLGHDFCTISLSDLLTPWETIERRVRAAGEGDFVIAFYNPVSMRRRDQLARASAILLDHRPAETPVVLARNLGREGETVTLTTLEALDPETVDMLTVVLVGNSQTRRIGGRVYTPRGYATKL